MVQPEGNNWWTFNAYGKGKILPEQVNNELDNLGQGGVQAAIRNIMHSRETAQLLLSGTSNLEPSGTYGDCDVAAGNILTRDSDGLSRIVPVAAATGLNIDTVAKCVVASNDGTSTVKAKTSVLSTDVIVATRGPVDDALVDVRNIKTEDDILSMALGGNLRVDGLSTVYKMGVDSVGYRTIVLKSGDSLVSAVAALGGAGNIILLPGTYTGSVALSSAINLIGVDNLACNIVGTVTISSANCSLQSVKVTGSVVLNGGYALVKGCTIIYSSNAYGITVGAYTGIKIESNLISGGFTRGISVSGAITNITIKHNEITGMASSSADIYGIILSGITGFSIIIGNIIHDVSSSQAHDIYGIYVSGPYHVISDNIIYNLNLSVSVTSKFVRAIRVSGDYSVIRGNIIYNLDCVTSNAQADTYAINLDTVTGCVVSNNLIRDIYASGLNSDNSCGIVAGTCTKSCIIGNSLLSITAGHNTFGILCSGGSENVVLGNVLVGFSVTAGEAGDEANHNNT